MTNKKKIILSIIVPVYNVEQYLQQCLNSIISYLTEEIEIIIVNDGSTDHSSAICDSFANPNKNIYVIHQKNKGLSGARNSGIKASGGEFLIFVDSDDYILSSRLSNILVTIKKNDACSFFFCDKYYQINSRNEDLNCCVGNDKTEDGLVVDSDKKRVIVKHTPVLWSACKVIVNRKFVLDNNIYFKENCLHEDIHWTAQLFLYSNKIYVIKTPWYYYRIEREASITNTRGIEHLKSYIKINRDLFGRISDSTIKEKPFLIVLTQRLSESMFECLKDYSYLSNYEKKQFIILLKENMDLMIYTGTMWQKLFLKFSKYFNVKLAVQIYKNVNIIKNRKFIIKIVGVK